MTHTQVRPERLLLEMTISENVNTLLHRSRMSASSLAKVVGMSKATLSRKLLTGSWTYFEVREIAEFFGVTTDEVASTLPTVSEWASREKRSDLFGLERPQQLPRLDSNQRPFGYTSPQVSRVAHLVLAA